MENRGVLDRQLQETYGETFAGLLGGESRSRQAIITVRKLDIPPLVVRKVVRTVQRVQKTNQPIELKRPAAGADHGTVIAYTPGESGKLQVADRVATLYDTDFLDLYSTAQDLARVYRVEPFRLLDELKRIYPEGALPASHSALLAEQVEQQTSQYKTVEEAVEVALALVKKEGFDKSTDEQGNATYTAEISYPIDRQELLSSYEAWKGQAGQFGFHYSPYNFEFKARAEFL